MPLQAVDGETSAMEEDGTEAGMMKLFLISDPEIRNYKLLTFQDMIAFTSDKKICFDMMNLSPFQYTSIL
jgi:hypothetical protein